MRKKNERVTRLFRTAGIIGWILMLAAPGLGKERIPALLITGENNHDWAYTYRSLKEILEDTELFSVTMTENPSVRLARDDLDQYRVFILDYNGKRWGEKAEEAFLAAVRGGVGVVIVHASNNAFEGWKDFEALVGLCWRKGTGHGKFHEFDVKIIDRNHPLTFGMPDLKAHPDELYHNLVKMEGANYRVLATAHSSKESNGTGKSEPMMTVSHFGKGRVFHTPLGHVWRGDVNSRSSHLDPQFRWLIARGAEWAATGQCSIEGKTFGLNVPAVSSGRPRSPWIFRCVLNEKPRMIVAALDPRMWVAYDAESCSFYRSWGGGVNFEGAVFTGEHGPQPTTLGEPFDEGPVGSVWTLKKEGVRESLTAQYLGYRIIAGRLRLQYRLTSSSGRVFLASESPECGALADPVLYRTFFLSGLSSGEAVEVNLGDLSGVSQTEGDALEIQKVGDEYRAVLQDGESVLRLTYHLTEMP